MLVFLSLYVILSIRLSILVCAAASLFCACLVSNIGSDHKMVMGSVTLNTRAERRKIRNKNTRKRVDTQIIGKKKNMFQLELKNRFTTLEERDDSLNKNII